MEANPGIEAARKLTHLGYRFVVNGETIKARYEGPGKPDPGIVRPLLETVKAHKPDVLAYLSKPAMPERILTCFECPMHEHDTVNPPEGWGRCTLKNKGCYGLRLACADLPRQDIDDIEAKR
jgi:hypothetical protein